MPASAIVAIVGVVTSITATVSTVAAVVGAEAAAAVGLSTGIGTALGTAIGGAVIGGGLGAAEAAITGQDPLKGAEFGAITGGIGGGLGSEFEQLGLSPRLAMTLGDAAGGALGAVATGKSPLTGALEGGVAGYLTGGGPNPFAKPGAATAGGGVASAASAAAPAGVAAAPDLGIAGGGGGLNLTPPSGGALDATATGFNTGAATGAALDSGGSGFASMSPNAVGGALPGDVGAGAASGAGSTGTAGIGSTPSGGGGSTNAPGGGNLTSSPVNASTLNKHPGGGFLGGPGGVLNAGLMGAALLSKPSVGPAENVLNSEANALRSQGGLMQGYLLSGTLPPGLQGTVNAATESAVAAIRSGYASRGMTGSSAEDQDISAARLRSLNEGAQLASNLFQQGLTETQMSVEIYGQLMQEQMQRDQQLQNSIGSFASALAMMGQPVSPGAGA
jgi:hypothetical protein